jgi:hypothetical protein
MRRERRVFGRGHDHATFARQHCRVPVGRYWEEPVMRRRSLFLGFAGCLAIAGCGGRPTSTAPFPDPGFAQEGVFRLNVNEIEVASTYRAPMVAPYVEHRFPVTPERMLQRWARDRLQATGGTLRRARFVIEDASVREGELARQTGLRAAFTDQQAVQYDGTLKVTLEIMDPTGERREGFASASAIRSQTVSENTPVADRERIAGDLIAALMVNFNAEMDRQIRANLGPFMR